MSVLGVIPARGGSKRVPRKNIKLLAGKPLIAYTIESAKRSKSIDRLIVSTDDQEIADVAVKYGAEVPFLRPAELAQDSTPDQPVFRHLLNKLREDENFNPDIMLNLRPTTPLKTPKTIDDAIKMILETDADMVRTMTRSEGVFHPYWMYRLSEDKTASGFLNNINVSDYYQSQMLPPVYRINGVVDAFKSDVILNGNILSCSNMKGLVIPEEEAVDIDTEMEFMLCEFLINLKNKEKI